MRLVITTGCAPRLESATDFKRFSLRLDLVPGHDHLTALAPVGEADGDSHAWVRPDALRALSPHAGQSDWEEGFAAMLRFAAQHGWTDAHGRIRAHIESTEAAIPVAPDVFRAAMRRFASGVCIVATGAGEERCGMTVSAFTSVSADPPLVLVCLNRASSAHARLTGDGVYSINILAAGQAELAMRFAGQTGIHGAARFDARWQQAAHGAPVLRDCLQSLICAPSARHEAGSHTLLVGQVIGTGGGAGRAALLNFDGTLQPTGQAA
ncbi:MAG: flavin reductase family protein [Pararhodobacter sp.]|nr:flavin reductase family protein [Pararhodobacter sp.]